MWLPNIDLMLREKGNRCQGEFSTIRTFGMLMSEKKPNKDLKSFKVSPEIHREAKLEAASTGEEIQEVVERAGRVTRGGWLVVTGGTD